MIICFVYHTAFFSELRGIKDYVQLRLFFLDTIRKFLNYTLR